MPALPAPLWSLEWAGLWAFCRLNKGFSVASGKGDGKCICFQCEDGLQRFAVVVWTVNVGIRWCVRGTLLPWNLGCKYQTLPGSWTLTACCPWRPGSAYLSGICPSLMMLYTQQQSVEGDIFLYLIYLFSEKTHSFYGTTEAKFKCLRL